MKRGIEKRAHRTLAHAAADARAVRDAIDGTVADLTQQLRMALHSGELDSDQRVQPIARNPFRRRERLGGHDPA